MKNRRLAAVLLLSLFVLWACGRTTLTTERVQRAVDQALDWTQKGGRAGSASAFRSCPGERGQSRHTV